MFCESVLCLMCETCFQCDSRLNLQLCVCVCAALCWTVQDSTGLYRTVLCVSRLDSGLLLFTVFVMDVKIQERREEMFIRL